MILDLALSLLALVAAVLAIGVAGWLLDAIEWLRGLLARALLAACVHRRPLAARERQ